MYHKQFHIIFYFKLIPKKPNIKKYIQYTKAVSKIDIDRLEQKDIFHPIKLYKAIKNVKEGGIIKRIFLDKSLMEFGSCVSKCSHIKANKDVNGMEATIPAMSVDLLAISEMITITKAVKIILIIVYIKLFNN